MSKKRNTNRNRNKRVRRERGHWLDAVALQPGSYLPADPRLTDITCPDCGASWSAPQRQRRAGLGGSLDHALTCPIGKGYADAAEDDRLWFAEHPDEDERHRLPTMAEVQAVMLSTGQALPDMPNGGQLEPAGQVVVRKLTEVLRVRDFSAAVLLVAPVLSYADGLHPDEFDETGQLWFREHVGPIDPEHVGPDEFEGQ